MYNNIESALKECSSYAEQGYRLARKSYDEIHQALLKEEEKVNNANRQQSQMTRIADSKALKMQMYNLEKFEQMDRDLQNDLNLLHKSQKEFSIVVFGRTMAGKSTLMEILTRGNGSSIGKGAQRTTLDVRDYYWQGMKITDVPGIASFDGKEDDKLAMEAAKSADLILFLITDDAPQEEEAKKLADLRNLGKPVLGIVNVKLALDMKRRALSLRKLQKKLEDTERLNAVCNQFKNYAAEYNQDWQEMPFVYTHLRAAYEGRKDNNEEYRDEELFNLSNFLQVEKFIIEKVCKDGCFLRIKTFIDRVAVPMQERMEVLLESSSQNVKEALIYRRKWHDLDDWKNNYFLERVKQRHENFIKKLQQDIDSEIDDFAYYNYDNSDAGDDWNKKVRAMNLEKRCGDFLQDLAKECEKKRRELTDELRTEIRFSSVNSDTGFISMDSITDTQSWFQLGALGIGLIFSGPIGIALGVLSFFFEDKQEKIRKQRRELKDKLKEAMYPVINKIDSCIVDEINNNILGKGLNGLRRNLVEMDEMLFELATEEKESAENLRDTLFKLNISLWASAAEYINVKNDEGAVLLYLGRIPGKIFQCIGEKNVPEKLCEQMSNLLDEKVVYISLPDDENESTDKYFDIITDLIGEWHNETLEFGENGEIRLIELDSDQSIESLKYQNGYRLMQQIRCEPILEY